ncbi:MAG: hypothetical protein WCC06_03425 [Candidatus Aminicenantales bacterium]
MKITHKELCELYKTLISEKIPPSRRKCPSLAALLKFFQPTSSRRNKAKIVEHVTHCAYCAHEFDAILEVMRGRQKLEEDLDLWLRSENARIPSRSKSNAGAFLLKLSWRNVLFFIAAGFLLLGLVTLFHNNLLMHFRSPNIKGIQSFPVRLIRPIDGQYPRSHLNFQWDTLPESEYSILELYDDTLALIWKSPKLHASYYSLPQEITDTLTRQKNYYWMVTVSLSDGRKIESALKKFFLVD